MIGVYYDAVINPVKASNFFLTVSNKRLGVTHLKYLNESLEIPALQPFTQEISAFRLRVSAYYCISKKEIFMASGSDTGK